MHVFYSTRSDYTNSFDVCNKDMVVMVVKNPWHFKCFDISIFQRKRKGIESEDVEAVGK